MAKAIKVKLTKSNAGASDTQLRTLRGLGLWRFNQERLLPDTAATRGMVFKVQHLVTLETTDQEFTPRERRKPKKIVRRDQARAKRAAEAK